MTTIHWTEPRTCPKCGSPGLLEHDVTSAGQTISTTWCPRCGRAPLRCCRVCHRAHESITPAGRLVVVEGDGACISCHCVHGHAGHSNNGCPLCARDRMWHDLGIDTPDYGGNDQ